MITINNFRRIIFIITALAAVACSPQPTPEQIVITATQPHSTASPTAEKTRIPTLVPTLTPAPTATHTQTPEPTRIVTFDAVIEAERLNLRDAPTISSEIVEQLEEGEIVSLLGKYGGGEWVKAAADSGKEGWLYTEFLVLQGALSELADLDVENGIKISGRVLDSAGNGVNAAQLTLIGDVSQDLTTDEAGYFQTLLAPGLTGIWEIRMGIPGCESAVMDLNCTLASYFFYNTSVLIELPDPAPAVFVLEQASGTVSGLTIGADELPVGQVRVAALREDGAFSAAWSDQNGVFRLPIGPGKWRLSITVLGEEGPAEIIELDAFQSIEDVILKSP